MPPRRAPGSPTPIIFLYLVKANQLASADPGKIKAPVLVLDSPTDLVFPAPLVEEAAETTPGAQTGTITGPNGHLNGVLAITQAADRICGVPCAVDEPAIAQRRSRSSLNELRRRRTVGLLWMLRSP